jgi:hypothetical protein
MSCCNQNCNQGRDCPCRKEIREQESIKHDIKLASIVVLISFGVIVFMTWFM